MELETLVLTARIFERALIVLFSGLSIFFGYRLFAIVPYATTGDGDVKLPWDVGIKVTRVAPGVFFSLFGSVLLAFSLHASVDIQHGAAAKTEHVTGVIRYATDTSTSEGSTDAVRQIIATHIEEINAALVQLGAGKGRHDLDDVKVILMYNVWDSDWGDFEEFSRQVRIRTSNRVLQQRFPDAFEYFSKGLL